MRERCTLGALGDAAMTAQARTVFWLGLLVLFCLLLWLLSSILLPFVLGMTIGFFLDPVVCALERRGVSRALASAGIIVGFFALASLAIVLVVPVIVEQATGLAARLPDLVVWARDSLVPIANRLLERFGMPRSQLLAGPSADLAQRAVSLVGGLASGVLSRGLAVFNLLALLAITPLVAFYLLRDWPRLVGEIDGWLPREHAEAIRAQARAVDAVLSGYARGSATVCVILAFFYGVALSIVGLDFGLVIGLAAGMISFVPYLGVIVGFGSSIGVALYQFWPDWVRIGIVAGVFFAGQILLDYVLTPRLVGEQVGLHPLWVIFAVLSGGTLFGFVGVLLAVPACAVIGVLVRFAISRYKESQLYLDMGG